HRLLHAFPTRRSSDLVAAARRLERRWRISSRRSARPLPRVTTSSDGRYARSRIRVPPDNLIRSRIRRTLKKLTWPDGLFVLSDPDRKSTRLNSSHVSI